MVNRTSLASQLAASSLRLHRGFQRAIQTFATRVHLINNIGQRAAMRAPMSASTQLETSAALNFAGTSSAAESLGGAITKAAAWSTARRHPAPLRSDGAGQIGSIEATRSPLIEVHIGAAAPHSATSWLDNLRVVSATAGTLSASVADALGRQLSAMPIAALLGLGGVAASENNSAPSGGNGGKTPPPASPTAVLTTPLALALRAARVTCDQISTVFTEVTPSIYVPPG